MSIKRMSDEEKATVVAPVIEGEFITATYTVRKSADGPRFAANTVFDFEGVTSDEMKLLALRGVVIDAQRDWRVLANANFGSATAANASDKIKVRDMLDRDRKNVDPVTRAKSALSKLSDADRAAILALYSKK